MRTYTFHIDLCDLAYIGVAFLGSGMAALLWFAGKQQKTANKFLVLALLITVWCLIRILLIKIQHRGSPLQFMPALGPLLYFYVLEVTQPDRDFQKQDLLHFTSLLLSLAFQAWPGGNDAALQGFCLISVIIYLFFSNHLIERFYQGIAFTNGDRSRYQMRWLQRILVGLMIDGASFALLSVTDHVFYRDQLPANCYFPFYMAMAILMLWMACMAFLKLEHRISFSAPIISNAILPQALKQKGALLKRALKNHRYHEDPELNLRSLAAKLDLHPNELSKIINAVFKKNFNDLINEYRVADVCDKMHDAEYDHLTLLGIAFESGFNSKTTFNRTFKEMTGKSPAEYKNELKKERPDYNLERLHRLAAVLSDQKPAPYRAETQPKRYVMLKNYVKIAWRNLLRNRSYATINITGLAVGIAACMLIFLVVQYETSFDNYHRNKARIYRIVKVSSGPDGIHTGVGTPVPLTDGLRMDFPQIKQLGNIMQNADSHYAVGDVRNTGALKKFKESLAYYADPGFFRIFDFKWLAGEETTALSTPNTIVLSREEANKFFGDWHAAMGKIVRFENNRDLEVTGIFEDTPVNTDIPMKLAVSWATLVDKGGELRGNASDWVSTFGAKNSYMILPDGVSEANFNKELVSFFKRHTPVLYNKDGAFRLQPLEDIHYNTETSVYSGHPFSRQLISVISLIGLFLLVIACVNFINLATAQAVNRSKEVGVRKVLGSRRRQLVMQFISETLIITLFAVGLGTIISLLTLPLLNELLETHLSRSLLISPVAILFMGGTVVGVTLLAGLYPALVLSGFNPVTALRNKITAQRASGISLRRVLVVAQFCIAQFLVIGTLILIYQMDYFKNRPLGFNKDAVITVPFPADSMSRLKISTLKEELLLQPGIKDVSLSFSSPSDKGNWSSDFKYNNESKPVDFAASLKWADPGYFKLYDMEFVAGGPYAKRDTVSGYVVNETLIHRLGITDPKQAIGKYIMLWDDKKLSAQITGVVKDFNVSSLRNAIPPVLMAAWKDQYAKLNIKIEPRNFKQTLAGIAAQWNKTFPEGVYEYKFLDQTIANFYKKEDQLSTLYKIFAGVAIFISCLGLYGLVSFMAVQRTKEVGIRKTLGASVGHIIYLFSKEFTVLILIAFAIAAPVGYYFMNRWLQNYTYRISIGADIFLWSIFASITIAWASVGFRAAKAALANPVKSLKSE